MKELVSSSQFDRSHFSKYPETGGGGNSEQDSVRAKTTVQGERTDGGRRGGNRVSGMAARADGGERAVM